jgi:hypothetical protein
MPGWLSNRERRGDPVRVSDLDYAGADTAMGSIAASFGIGLGLGAGAEGAATEAAGLPRRGPSPKQPVFPFTPQPYLLIGTAVGSFVQADLFSPQSGWIADITSISCAGFTAGSIVATKGAPAVTAAGNPVAIEYAASFPQAGLVLFPQGGVPLLDANDTLYFTVTAALTLAAGAAGAVITATGIMVPVTRMDGYLS